MNLRRGPQLLPAVTDAKIKGKDVVRDINSKDGGPDSEDEVQATAWKTFYMAKLQVTITTTVVGGGMEFRMNSV